ncbi:MAG: cell division protein ZapA [Alphaproteobacteria bacterium]|nr:cell division protein ZapA [Alphaproteobacteria bacterium]
MAQVTVTINNREYGIACEDGQEVRIIQLAKILDNKAKLLTANAQQVNENMLLAMVGLLLADELTELKKNPENRTDVVVESIVDNSRIANLDKETAEKIKNITDKIKSVASILESL